MSSLGVSFIRGFTVYKITSERVQPFYTGKKKGWVPEHVHFPFFGGSTVVPCSCRVEVLTSGDIPGGCTMTTVGASCEVHLMLRGMVDVAKEVARLDEKIEKLTGQISKMKKSMAIENYEERVSSS